MSADRENTRKTGNITTMWEDRAVLVDQQEYILHIREKRTDDRQFLFSFSNSESFHNL